MPIVNPQGAGNKGGYVASSYVFNTDYVAPRALLIQASDLVAGGQIISAVITPVGGTARTIYGSGSAGGGMVSSISFFVPAGATFRINGVSLYAVSQMNA